jgi:hypothetical protein
MKKLFLIFVFAAASPRAELQFSGYFVTANEALFTFNDGAESSGWLAIGDSFRSYTVRSFDRESEVITLEKSGQPLRLHLRDSKVRDGRMKIDGTITFWPGQKTEGFQASLVLGEEEVFPIKPGVTLHLTAEKRTDGNILYRSRLVTTDGTGKEASELWPNVVTSESGAFGLRVGDIGFSFKP